MIEDEDLLVEHDQLGSPTLECKYNPTIAENRGNVKGAAGDNIVTRPRGNWPGGWVDMIHEEDGGMDKFGGRIRDGRNEMKEHLHALLVREGVVEAWDDVIGGGLPAHATKTASEEEI